MANTGEGRHVTALEFVEALADRAGSAIEIDRNGADPVRGVLVDTNLSSSAVEGRTYLIVHLLMNRPTRDGTAPTMVSLLTGAPPDEDFFWPACLIKVTGLSGYERFLLR